MSLVAYGSSDESDSEETSAVPSKPSAGGLFSLLPAPKKPVSAGRTEGPAKKTALSTAVENSSSADDPEPQPSKGSLFSSLPKPRKRTEPVKITVPQIQRQDVSTEPLQLFAHTSCTYCDTK